MSSIAALPIGAFTLDQELSVRSADPAFLDLLGYRVEEVVGLRIQELVLASDRDLLAPFAHLDVRDSGQLELRFVSALGSTVAATIVISRLQTSDDGAHCQLRVLLTALNGSDPQQCVARLDDAMALAHVASWELDIASGTLFASQGWLDLWGISPEAPLSRERILQLVHPEDRAELELKLAEAVETSKAFRSAFRIIKPSGEARWVECSGRHYASTTGQPGRLYGAVVDITSQRRAELALARYADIVSSTPDRIAFVDRSYQLLTANAAFLSAVGRTLEHVVGRPFAEVCGDSPLTSLVYDSLERCLERSDAIVEDVRETGRDGTARDYEARLFPHRDEQNRATGIVVSVRDVTAIRDAERRLLQSAAVYAATSEGVLITDASGTIVGVNAAFTQITGYAESEVVGQKPNLLNSQWHTKGFFVGMWRRLLRHGSWQGEVWNRRKDGEVYRQRLTIRRVLDPRGKLVNFVGVFAERTTSPETPHRAEHQLHYDALTKLPNRLLFESRLEHAIELGDRKESPLAVFVLDLDHFSHINSSLGHQIGDDLLRAVALKLREAIRPADTLARLRADQFGLLFEEVGDLDEITEIARRLQDTMRQPLWVRSHLLHVNVSIGIALSIGTSDNRSSMVAKAESALRQAKRQGRNRFQISTAEPEALRSEHKHVLQRLKTALERDELELLYRPGIDMDSDVCDYVESCIHWDQREFGPIPHERLMSLASESGLLLEITDWALETTCRRLQGWLDDGLPILAQGTRIYEAQLTQGDLVRRVAHLIDGNPALASRLVLEFSECLLAKHREQIAEVFQGLNQLGVGIVLSDVGIGWTAPGVLQRLPIRSLKIHSSFIEALPDSAHELAVVEAVIAMAQSLRLDIRADGVRTQEQKYQLMNLGCNRAQGDLFSEPLSAAQLEQWLSPKGKDDGARPPQKS